MGDYLLLTSRSSSMSLGLRQLEARAVGASHEMATARVHRSSGRFSMTIGAPDATVFFDGLGVLDSVFFRSGEAPPAVGRGRGCYMIARTAPDGRVVIEADPLGQYPIFVYRRSGLFGITNNVFLLVDALRALGRRVEKNLALFGSFVAIGTGMANATGFADIELLPLGAIVTVSPRNAVTIDAPPLASYLYSERSYQDLLEEAGEEMLTNVRALANGPFEYATSDLSGGMDSRLVLATILYAGQKERFLFRTAGSYPNPDANTAALVRKQLHLQRGTSLDPPPDPNVSEHLGMRVALGRRGGLMETYYGVSPSVENMLRLSGGCGELMRSFYRTAEGRPPFTLQMRRMAKDRYLIGSRAFRSLQSTLQAWRVRLTREGVRDEHLADAFYLTCRSRYHFGVHWRASRNCKFYPLYSPAAIKAAHSLPESERLANRVGFDLMHRFSPELTQLPFANKTWNPLIMSNPPSPITTQSASLFDPLEAPICLYPKHARRKSPLERELRKRGLRATIIRFQGILDDFHRSQRTFNFESLSPVFKPKAVSHVLSADPVLFDSNRAVCKGCRLLAAYLWANHMEIPPSRVVVASM